MVVNLQITGMLAASFDRNSAFGTGSGGTGDAGITSSDARDFDFDDEE